MPTSWQAIIFLLLFTTFYLILALNKKYPDSFISKASETVIPSARVAVFKTHSLAKSMLIVATTPVSTKTLAALGQTKLSSVLPV